MSSTTAMHWTRSHGTLLLAVSLEPREIGRRIAEARERKGWTQLAFALEANVSPSTTARWEAGKLPPVRELIRIAELLGVEPEWLVEPTATLETGERLAALERELETVRQGLDDLRAIREQLARIEDLLLGRGGSARRGPASA